jgi:hypothetical protein
MSSSPGVAGVPAETSWRELRTATEPRDSEKVREAKTAKIKIGD